MVLEFNAVKERDCEIPLFFLFFIGFLTQLFANFAS